MQLQVPETKSTEITRNSSVERDFLGLSELIIDQETFYYRPHSLVKSNKIKTGKKENYHLGNLETLNNSWVKETIK